VQKQPYLPPKDVPASELFLKLMESPAPSEIVDLPRRDKEGNPVGRIRIRVLSMLDHDRARVEAHKRVKRLGIATEDMSAELIKEVLGDAAAKEILAMACMTEGEDGALSGRVFRNADDVEKLPADEVAALFNAYMIIQHKYGPLEHLISTPEELNAWIKRLGEGAASVSPLHLFTLPALAELASSLGARTYLLSRTLASLWSTLPDSLKSDLKDYSLDTDFYGSPAASTTAEPSSGSSENFDDMIDLMPGETLSAEDAMALARERK